MVKHDGRSTGVLFSRRVIHRFGSRRTSFSGAKPTQAGIDGLRQHLGLPLTNEAASQDLLASYAEALIAIKQGRPPTGSAKDFPSAKKKRAMLLLSRAKNLTGCIESMKGDVIEKIQNLAAKLHNSRPDSVEEEDASFSDVAHRDYEQMIGKLREIQIVAEYLLRDANNDPEPIWKMLQAQRGKACLNLFSKLCQEPPTGTPNGKWHKLVDWIAAEAGVAIGPEVPRELLRSQSK